MPDREPGRSLTNFLFPAPAPRTLGGIIAWWERRRLPYNVIVGAAGLVTLSAGTVAGWLLGQPGFLGGPFMWQGVVAYGVLANLCYLLGPATEWLVEKVGRGSILPTGPVLYRMGLTFSVGLTLLPIVLFTIAVVARVVLGLG